MFGSGYSSTKLKINLNLAIKRLKLLQQKYDNAGSLTRKEVASYLQRDKLELAQIKTEQIIRDDYYREALEILEMYCSLLLTRMGLLDSRPDCDESLREAVYTLIWCAPRLSVDLNEFSEIKKQFALRFGKDLINDASSEKCPYVSERIVHKLQVAVPPKPILMGYLRLIAETFKVEWKWGADPSIMDEAVPIFNNDTNGHSGYGGAGGGGINSEKGICQDLQRLEFPAAIGVDYLAFPPVAQPPSTGELYPPAAAGASPLYPPPRQLSAPPPYNPPLEPFGPTQGFERPVAGPETSVIPMIDPAVPTALPGRGGAPPVRSPPPGTESVPGFDELAQRLNALKRQ